MIPAKRRQIPTFHMKQAIVVLTLESLKRRIVALMITLLILTLPTVTIARDYLLQEGLPSDQIVKTGSPMYEVLHHYLPQIRSSNVLSRLKLKSEGYFLVSAHREENIESDRSLQ